MIKVACSSERFCACLFYQNKKQNEHPHFHCSVLMTHCKDNHPLAKINLDWVTSSWLYPHQQMQDVNFSHILTFQCVFSEYSLFAVQFEGCCNTNMKNERTRSILVQVVKWLWPIKMLRIFKKSIKLFFSTPIIDTSCEHIHTFCHNFSMRIRWVKAQFYCAWST